MGDVYQTQAWSSWILSILDKFELSLSLVWLILLEKILIRLNSWKNRSLGVSRAFLYVSSLSLSPSPFQLEPFMSRDAKMQLHKKKIIKAFREHGEDEFFCAKWPSLECDVGCNDHFLTQMIDNFKRPSFSKLWTWSKRSWGWKREKEKEREEGCSW